MTSHRFSVMLDSEVPSWSSVEGGLKSLKELLATNPSKEKLLSVINEIPFVDYHLIRQNGDWLKKIYRARQPSSAEDINRVSTFSLPRAEQTPQGRANQEGYPVFYGSLLADTAIQETLDREKGDIVYVGDWVVQAPANMKQFLHPRQALDNEIVGEFHYGLLTKLRSTLREYTPENQIILERLAGYLGDYFLQDNDYRVSSLLGHKALYEWDAGHGCHIDMICYPSAAKAHNALNFAISKRFAEEHLTLQSVKKYRVKSTVLEGSEVELLAVGIPDALIINWHEVSSDFRRTAWRFEGVPDNNLKYQEETIQIDGKHELLSAIIDQIWIRESNRILNQVWTEHLLGNISTQAKRAGIEVTSRGATYVYEGQELDAIKVAIELEYRLILQPIQS